METFFQDLRYAIRMLMKSPAFSVVTVLSIALGIGTNVAVFSMVNGILFKPMPVERPEQLVALYGVDPSFDFPIEFSYLDYLDYRNRTDVFSDVVCHTGYQLSMSRTDGQPELIWGEMVSANYFSGLGVNLALGRGFLPEEDQKPGAAAVAVLNYGFWQNKFAADQSVIGKTINLNGHQYNVVGVAQKGFIGTRLLGYVPDVWVPVMMHAQVMNNYRVANLNRRDWTWLQLRARLQPGVSIEQARAVVKTTASQIEQSYPDTNKGISADIIPAGSRTDPFFHTLGIATFTSWLMMGIVSLVLAIACANVANLMLARSTARQKEIAVKLALGASRGRLVRQLLTESVLYALIGGGLGIFIATWLIDSAWLFVPQLDFQNVIDFGIDRRVLIFALMVSLVTGLLFGLAPALKATKPNLVPMLKGETEKLTTGNKKFALRNALVVAQMAMSLLLLICAGLFIRSLQNVQTMDLGFETKNIILESIDPALQGYDEGKAQQLYKQLTERISQLPDVQATSVAFPLPLDSETSASEVVIDGVNTGKPDDKIVVFRSTVGFDYFNAMNTPIMTGREFNQHDSKDSTRVVIINQTMAERYWKSQDPMGKKFKIGGPTGEYHQVIGVARDGKYLTPGEAPMSFLYLPLSQNFQSPVRIIARTGSDPKALAATIRSEVKTLDANLPVFGVKTMTVHLSRILSLPQTIAALVGFFGFLALVLAAVGIYGMMAYSVTQRMKELGIRLALGAQRRDMLRLILGHGLALTLTGIVIGLIGALTLTRMLASLLYDVNAIDPLTFIVVALILAAVALLACYIPARRAMNVDPMIVLRYE
jgi:predicted permease